MLEPMKPAPPVTKYRVSSLLAIISSAVSLSLVR